MGARSGKSPDVAHTFCEQMRDICVRLRASCSGVRVRRTRPVCELVGKDMFPSLHALALAAGLPPQPTREPRVLHDVARARDGGRHTPERQQDAPAAPARRAVRPRVLAAGDDADAAVRARIRVQVQACARLDDDPARVLHRLLGVLHEELDRRAEHDDAGVAAEDRVRHRVCRIAVPGLDLSHRQLVGDLVEDTIRAQLADQRRDALGKIAHKGRPSIPAGTLVVHPAMVLHVDTLLYAPRQAIEVP